MLDNVTIIRSRGRDVAIVEDRVKKEEQEDLARRITRIYPAVREVIFSDEKPFEGRMYVAKTIKPKPL